MAAQTSTIQPSIITHPRVLPHDEWVKERVAFMAKEKEFTRLRDELSRERRELPGEGDQVLCLRRAERQGDAGRAL